MWFKDQCAFGAKTRITRKVEKNRDVMRKSYIHFWAANLSEKVLPAGKTGVEQAA